MHQKKIITAGQPLRSGGKALILLHGRGATAQDILGLASELNVKDYSLLAPQATNHTWYPFSFLALPTQNEPWLSSAIHVIEETVNDIRKKGIADDHIYFAGFSQGACLTLEFVTRNATRWGGAVAFTGGLIGDKLYPERYHGDFDGTPIFIGTSDPDPHVPVERVHESVLTLKSMHANVIEKIYRGMGHTINRDELDTANKLVFS